MTKGEKADVTRARRRLLPLAMVAGACALTACSGGGAEIPVVDPYADDQGDVGQTLQAENAADITIGGTSLRFDVWTCEPVAGGGFEFAGLSGANSMGGGFGRIDRPDGLTLTLSDGTEWEAGGVNNSGSITVIDLDVDARYAAGQAQFEGVVTAQNPGDVRTGTFEVDCVNP